MEFRHPFDPATGLPGDGSVVYSNGDLATGTEGSIPPAEAIHDPQREICHAIDFFLGDGTEGSGQDADDLEQLRKAMQAAANSGDFLEAADFPVTLADNGTQLLANGLILKWGTVTAPAIEQLQTLVFPIAFPTACFIVAGQHVNASGSLAGNDAVFQVRSKSAASFEWAIAVYTGGDDGDRTGHWFALGH